MVKSNLKQLENDYKLINIAEYAIPANRTITMVDLNKVLGLTSCPMYVALGSCT